MRCRVLLAVVSLATMAAGTAAAAAADVPDPVQIDGLKTIEINVPTTPPEWALWQRHLLDQLCPAAVEFVRKYTRPDGTLIWRDRWPGMDGSDDGYESFYNFPLYYALGGPEEIHRLSRELWDGVTRQFTEYGQIHNEFDAYYDWMHHGESYTYFYFFGLADPNVRKTRERAQRFAGMYMNEDPDAPNYDPKHKLIRSPINGSRGPRFINSAEDWVTHRPILADYPLPFDDIPNVTDSSAWIAVERGPFILESLNSRMMRADVPLNLTATSLILNAYMYTGEPKYKQWIEDYVGAWMEKTRNNDGILPDNVGPNGKIGETMDGKWWGGYYGWRWPHGLFNQVEATLIGASNAYLLTGDAKYLELPRSVLELVRSQARVEKGHVVVPHRHGDEGWYDYRPIKPAHLVYLWYISQDDRDYRLMEALTDVSGFDTLRYEKRKGDWENPGSWLGFIEGRNPDYPVEILKVTYAECLRRLERIRNDRTTPAEQDVHHWQRFNPVVLEGLVQTMLGAPNHVYHGGLLHCRVFYFDSERKRPGLPPGVAALVDKVAPDEVSLHLVNLEASRARSVIIQAGAFGEHQFTSVRHNNQTIPICRKFFQVHLRPGAGARMDIGMKRFAHRPAYGFPWHDDQKPVGSPTE